MTTNPQSVLLAAAPSPASAPESPVPCVLVSGGGSGGHVFPGLAIARELRARGWDVNWMGSPGGYEARLVPGREIPFFPITAKPVVGQGLLGKISAALTLLHSAWDARRMIRQIDARVVVGTGGYVSVPAVVGSRLAGRPILLFEPNAEPGAANRWLSRIATEAATAFPGTEEFLRCPTKLTGIPVREAFFQMEEPADQPLRILILGGSQGAKQLNQLLPQALGILGPGVGDLAVCHQVGERHVDATQKSYGQVALDHVQVEVVPFLEDVAGAMARSHLVISRAGAITLAELCAAGKPSILVPLSLAGAHQVANARRLEDAGAAILLAPEQVDAALLAEHLKTLLTQPESRQSMGEAARQLGHADAAVKVADRIEALGGLN